MTKKVNYDKSWNFKEGTMNELNHLIHPYPAMLMPLIVRKLLNIYGKKEHTKIFDPYVGSGTTLVESMLYGAKEVVGVDLNPMALMISQAKITKYDLSALKSEIIAFEKFVEEFVDTQNITIDLDEIYNFSLRDSWFKPNNSYELDKIKSYINDINDANIQLFFKVSFSQVVRIVSLTRNGEFKLYRIPKNKIDDFNPNAFIEMKNVLSQNIQMLERTHYKLNYETVVNLHMMNAIEIIKKKEYINHFDLIITSPPYGDSHTTVAYGQFSRLANEWLGIDNAQQLDRELLGGRNSKEKVSSFEIEELDDVISKIMIYDSSQKTKRYPAVISFYRDYINSINSVSKTVKSGGYVIYVVGNRRVRNFELPTDVVTQKAFEKNGFEHQETIIRDILNKRMPSKASPSNRVGGQISTMTKEYIVIMKKA